MIATTTPAPIRSISGPPVNERTVRIAEYVAELEASYLRGRADGADLEFLDRVTALIVRQSWRYDYYNH